MKILKQLKNKKWVPVEQKDLKLKNTLVNGQAFSWSPVQTQQQNTIAYEGVIDKYYIYFEQNENEIKYKNIPNNDIQDLLQDYFQFNENYDDLINRWKNDKNFEKVLDDARGLRVLRQDPFECLICFILSQNNNIARITQLYNKIVQKYGSFIYETNGRYFYQFPSLQQLANSNEQELRNLGLGYRASYIVDAVKQVQMEGLEWLKNHRKMSQKEVQASLVKIKGVGKKVADCVGLFSLDQNMSVPVDTHVWQIYNKDYGHSIKGKVTTSNYDQVSEFFQKKFGEKAGWAHSFLFFIDLPQNKKLNKNKQEHEEDKLSKKVRKQ